MNTTAEPYLIETRDGIANVENISFELTRHFKQGSYIINIKDKTVGLPKAKRLPDKQVLLKIVDMDFQASETVSKMGGAGAAKKKGRWLFIS